jgi:dethiobiotin synthetase
VSANSGTTVRALFLSVLVMVALFGSLVVLQLGGTAAGADAEFTVVEGAGGLLVPINEATTMADLAREWQLPVLIVARSGLGTLNHTALTVQAARARGLDVLGVVLNRWPEDPDVATRTNPAELEQLTDVEVLGRLPELPEVDTEGAHLGRLGEAVADTVDLTPVFDSIDRSPTHART